MCMAIRCMRSFHSYIFTIRRRPACIQLIIVMFSYWACSYGRYATITHTFFLSFYIFASCPGVVLTHANIANRTPIPLRLVQSCLIPIRKCNCVRKGTQFGSVHHAQTCRFQTTTGYTQKINNAKSRHYKCGHLSAYNPGQFTYAFARRRWQFSTCAPVCVCMCVYPKVNEHNMANQVPMCAH